MQGRFEGPLFVSIIRESFEKCSDEHRKKGKIREIERSQSKVNLSSGRKRGTVGEPSVSR